PSDPPAGEILVELPVDGPRALTGVRTPHGYVLRVHGMCDFMVDLDLGAIECRPEPEAEAAYLPLFLGGSVLAFVLGLKGECVLHASTVEVGNDGSAVAFVGAAGVGKSTMAGLACASGARFVADDLLRLSPGPRPGWIGGAAELRLRPNSMGAVDPTGRGWATRATVDGRVATTPPRSAAASGPLSAIVLPCPSRSAPFTTVERLSPADALLALTRFPRLTVWRCPQALEAQFDGTWRLARSVPVYLATVPWGPPFPDGLGLELLSLIGINLPTTGGSGAAVGAEVR
ncbi:MAG: hypothetical protein ACRD0I_10380, partial [Acidimicrobiales bacterium]